MKKLLITLLSVMMICGLVTTNVCADSTAITELDVTANFASVDITDPTTFLISPSVNSELKPTLEIYIYGEKWDFLYRYCVGNDGTTLGWYDTDDYDTTIEASSIDLTNVIGIGYYLTFKYEKEGYTIDQSNITVTLDGNTLVKDASDSNEYYYFYTDANEKKYLDIFRYIPINGGGNSKDINVSFTLEEESIGYEFSFDDSSDLVIELQEEGNYCSSSANLSISEVTGLPDSKQISVYVSSKNSFYLAGNDVDESISYEIGIGDGSTTFNIETNNSLVFAYAGDDRPESGTETRAIWAQLDASDFETYTPQTYSDVLTFTACVENIEN